MKGTKKKGQMETMEAFEGNTPEQLKEFLGNRLTLRQCLGKVMSFFDSTGVASPMLCNLRYIIRLANMATPGEFDVDLPEDLFQYFCEQMISMQKFKDYEYRRTGHRERLAEEKFEIVSFSDAGQIGKQVVLYTRAKVGPNEFEVSFLTARNCLSKPIQNIPKSELDSLYLAALTVSTAQSNLDPHVSKAIAFSDSSISLYWILGQTHALQLFHRTRVSQIIQAFTDNEGNLNIYWIKSEKNVSDCGTRALCTPEDVSPSSAFFLGPDFLKTDLEISEKEGFITKISNLRRKLAPSEESQVNDGLLYKNGSIVPNNGSTLDESIEIEADTISNTAVPFASATKDLYEKGGYLLNPLDYQFKKYVLILLIAFKFVKKLMLKCFARNVSNSFEKILAKWGKRAKEERTFSFLGNTNFDRFKLEMEASSYIRAINLYTENAVGDKYSYGLASFINKMVQERVSKLSENTSNDDVSKFVLSMKAIHKQLGNEDGKTVERQNSIRKTKSFMNTSKDVEKGIEPSLKQIRCWQRYPGVLSILNGISELRKLIDTERPAGGRPKSEIEIAAAVLINTSNYIRAYKEYDYTNQLALKIREVLRIITLKAEKEDAMEIEAFIRNFTPEKNIKTLTVESHQSVIEMLQWFMIDQKHLVVDNLFESTNQSLPLSSMIPRILLPRIIEDQLEFSELQLLCFNHLHQILTNEIKGTWSKKKIDSHCIESNGKLISSWRLRAGAEISDILSDELTEADAAHINVRQNWPGVSAVGDKNSPLVISIAMHYHYNGSLNPLGRPKLIHHRGIHFIQAQVFQLVVVPGILEMLTKVRDECSICRLRLNRFYQAMMSPLPPTTHMFNPGFLTLMLDQGGPYKLKLLQSSRETRYKQHTKMYVCIFVCLATKAVHLELCEDMTPQSLASAISRLSCIHQAPAIIYCDRHQSNLNVVSNLELHVQTNNLLIRHKNIRYQLAPVGKHHFHGQVEIKVRALNRLLGKLDLESNPMTILSFQTMLLQIKEVINAVPLGTSLSSSDGSLQLVTPSKLIGKIDARRLMSPIVVPPDVSGIMSQNAERWKNLARIFSKSILPAMVKNTKWYQDVGEPLEENAIVMFQKRSSNNFLNDWSLARIVKVHKGSDGKVRSATIEYVGSSDGDVDIELDGLQQPKKEKRQTTRDAIDLIRLFPVCSSLDTDLKQLHYELLMFEKRRAKEDLLNIYERFKAKTSNGSISFTTNSSCVHGIPLQGHCKGCILIESLDKSETSTMKIFCKNEEILQSKFYHSQEMFRKIGQIFEPGLGLQDEVKISSKKNRACITFNIEESLNITIGIEKLASLILARVACKFEKPKETLPFQEELREKDIIIEFANPNLAYRVSLTAVKAALKHELKISTHKLKKRPELLQVSQILDQYRVKVLPNLVTPKGRDWEEEIYQQKAENMPGCTPSCCCISHCSIVHLPGHLGLEEDF